MRKAAVFNWGIYQLAGLTRVRFPDPRWKVGIYRPDRLGDFILSIGAIRSILEQAGERNCVLLHSRVAAEIAAREFPGLTRIQLPDLHGKLWITWANVHSAKFRRQLGKGIGDMLCLRHYRALFDEVALRVIPSRRVWCVSNSEHYRLEFEIAQRRFSGDVEVPRPAPTGDKTVCEDLLCHQRLLEAWKEGPVGIATVVPRLSVSALRRQNTLVISPFASDPIRDLPFDALVACILHAASAWGLEPQILTPPAVVAKYESLARRLAEKGCQVTVRVTRTVDELIEALASGTAVFTADTATAHLATALDLPMVCLLGGGHYGCFAPWRRSERQIWLSHPMDCYSCRWECVHPQPYCITRVLANDIVDAFQRVMSARA